jgi:predicted dehydrogenase
MINAAIVGLGRWGQTLVASVQGKSDRLRFATAVTRDPARSRDFLDRHGLALVATLDAALDDPGIDAVVLATPHSTHADQIVAVARAGKAVFCEKPLTLTRDEAERAVASCREAGIVLGVGTDKRFFPALQELARLAASGELGRLLHIEANFSNEVAATMFSPWRDSPDESPAGGMTGTGIHALDAMIRMAGPVRRVQALMLSHRPAPDPLDTISVLLEFRSGVSGMLAAVRSTPLFWRVHVFGRDGSAEALGRTELVLRRSGEKPQRLTFPEIDSVRANLEAFADAVAGIAPYPIGTGEMIDVVAAFEAIAQAAQSSAAASDGTVREV